jgi:branched-chain amino acid aminotransferase
MAYPLLNMEPAPYALHDGKLVDFAQAVLPVDSPAVIEARTVFGLMVACWNNEHKQLYVHRLERHCERLMESMKIAGISVHQSRKQLQDAVLEILARNGIKGRDLTVRILAYEAAEGDLRNSTGLTVLVHIRNGPFAREIEPREIWTGSRRRIPDYALPARAKAASNYENGRISFGDFYLNLDGKVSEFLTASVFIVRYGVALTPSLQDDQLESITRDTFIELLGNVHGVPVRQRSLDRSELYLADEMWGGASGTGIFPIIKVDGRQVGNGKPGPIFEALRRTFHAVHYGYEDLYPEWRTPVF